MAKALLVLHGPNLNLLGTREPDIYGRVTLAQIDAELLQLASSRGARLESFQTNHEGILIDKIQAAPGAGFDFIVINPAGFTHTSVPLRDALAAVSLPYIEVHLSNIHRREAWRKHSYFSDKAVAVICGLGVAGYRAAASFALDNDVT